MGGQTAKEMTEFPVAVIFQIMDKRAGGRIFPVTEKSRSGNDLRIAGKVTQKRCLGKRKVMRIGKAVQAVEAE
jgi:hypothetical protein